MKNNLMFLLTFVCRILGPMINHPGSIVNVIKQSVQICKPINLSIAFYLYMFVLHKAIKMPNLAMSW